MSSVDLQNLENGSASIIYNSPLQAQLKPEPPKSKGKATSNASSSKAAKSENKYWYSIYFICMSVRIHIDC